MLSSLRRMSSSAAKFGSGPPKYRDPHHSAENTVDRTLSCGTYADVVSAVAVFTPTNWSSVASFTVMAKAVGTHEDGDPDRQDAPLRRHPVHVHCHAMLQLPRVGARTAGGSNVFDEWIEANGGGGSGNNHDYVNGAAGVATLPSNRIMADARRYVTEGAIRRLTPTAEYPLRAQCPR